MKTQIFEEGAKMGPYRTPAPRVIHKLPRRSPWKKLLCLLGFHEGPFTIGLHVIMCNACRRIASD